MPPHPPDGSQETNNPNYKIEPMKKRFESVIFVPFFTQFLSDISQTQTPRKRPYKGIDDEPRQVHFRDTGWESDERPNDWQ